MGHFPPGETLPDSEADRDGWIEVTTRCGGTGDDSKSNANSEAPADLEDTAEGCGIGLGGVEVKGTDGCYAREANALSVPWPRNNLHEVLARKRRLP